MSDASYACTGDLRTLGKSLGLPQHLKDILAGFVCHQNYSNETSKLRNRIHLINISVSFLEGDLMWVSQAPVGRAQCDSDEIMMAIVLIMQSIYLTKIHLPYGCYL